MGGGCPPAGGAFWFGLTLCWGKNGHGSAILRAKIISFTKAWIAGRGFGA